MSTTAAKLARAMVLVGVWVALWGTLSVANVASGLVAVTVVLLLSPVAVTTGITLRPLAALRYGLLFLWLLVASTYDVTREVLRPRVRLRSGIAAVPLRTDSTVVATVVANTITLTPGTLTVELRTDPTVLYVHALQLRDPARLHAIVARLEDLASAALLQGPSAGRSAT